VDPRGNITAARNPGNVRLARERKSLRGQASISATSIDGPKTEGAIPMTLIQHAITRGGVNSLLDTLRSYLSVSPGAVSALGISRCFGRRPELKLANRRRVTERGSNATVRVDDVQLYQTRLTGKIKKRRCRTRRSLLIFLHREISQQ
jgi:hypothetical protein